MNPSSSLYAPCLGVLKALSPEGERRGACPIRAATVRSVEQSIKEMATTKNYPCVPALLSMKNGEYLVGIYNGFGTGQTAKALFTDLMYFREKQRADHSLYYSFWAVFESSQIPFSEFENDLWRELSALTSLPENDGAWDTNFSSNPADPNFCISLGGDAFFVVGMHPESPRLARQFPYSTIIFNLYDQFEELSRRGQYEAIVKQNRMREMRYQGSLNPMVEKYGDKWEAIQFSGQENSPEWKCPFHQKV